MIIADKKFIINSSREKIWECVLKALMRCMSFEAMQFTNERAFSALLRLRIGFIALPMHVKVEIVNIEKFETIEAKIRAKGMGELIWFNQRVSFTLMAINKSKTEVTAEIVNERMALVLRTLLLWKVKNFARETLDRLEVLLRQWTT